MKRRDFLKGAVPATVLPFMLGGYSVKAFANNPYLDRLIQAGNDTDHVFVLIQLSGGNDGLNTVIPLDQYSAIMAARSNIAITESSVLKLTTATGLNPAMTGLQNLFNQQKLRVVQSVGYPTPNFSHFRSTDIWLTGADYYQTLPTGWMGRFLDHEYPGYPVGYPSTQMPDPLAIQIGSAVSTGLEGPTANMGLAFSNPGAFYNIINDKIPSAPATRAGFELSYVRSIGKQLETFAVPVKNAAAKGTSKSTMWPTAKVNGLADQLKIVAQLIAGGLKTRIYVVNLGGFDTHTGQRAAQDPLLTQLSVAISAFQDELKQYTLEDRVVGMTFSEFGRRIKSNSSGGTDHGAAAPLFVFGSQVIPGILGTNPVLPTNATVDDNLNMQFDFRSIYASIMTQWFGTDSRTNQNLLYADFPQVPIIRGSAGVTKAAAQAASLELYQNFPNPFNPTTQIKFHVTGGHTTLRVFDVDGRTLSTIVDRELQSGEYQVAFDATGLASGTYLYRLQTLNGSATKSMVVTK
jgi:uncharacterized protein (DUF1501 family)